MALVDLTKESVNRAVAEFRRLGREVFLAKYGFKPARDYFLIIDGEKFDSKAIAGVAHGFARPDLGKLFGRQFSGGEATVWKALSDLGFSVTKVEDRNPDWHRDELIVALNFYLKHRPRLPGKQSGQIAALSALLNSLGSLLHSEGAGATFRNINGVYMKLMNFRRFDPSYTATGAVGLTRGGRGDKLVWDEFAADPLRLSHTAQTIIAAISQKQDIPALDHGVSSESPYMSEAPEGRLITDMHRRRERSRKLIENKKKSVLMESGQLACEACGFDFALVYGPRGQGFAECHHTRPLSSYKPNEKTQLKDLAILCANCHRMIHSGPQWLSISELKQIIIGASR